MREDEANFIQAVRRAGQCEDWRISAQQQRRRIRAHAHRRTVDARLRRAGRQGSARAANRHLERACILRRQRVGEHDVMRRRSVALAGGERRGPHVPAENSRKPEHAQGQQCARGQERPQHQPAHAGHGEEARFIICEPALLHGAHHRLELRAHTMRGCVRRIGLSKAQLRHSVRCIKGQGRKTGRRVQRGNQLARQARQREECGQMHAAD